MAVTPINTPEPEKVGSLDDLTAAETAMAERKAAQSITTLGNDAFPQVTLLGALGWALARRSDQRLTFDRYMETNTVAEITRSLGLGASADDDDDTGKDD